MSVTPPGGTGGDGGTPTPIRTPPAVAPSGPGPGPAVAPAWSAKPSDPALRRKNEERIEREKVMRGSGGVPAGWGWGACGVGVGCRFASAQLFYSLREDENETDGSPVVKLLSEQTRRTDVNADAYACDWKPWHGPWHGHGHGHGHGH